MKGYVKLDIKNGIEIIDKCIQFINTPPTIKKHTYQYFDFKKFKKVDKVIEVYPSWYSNRVGLECCLSTLKELLLLPSPIYLSLIVYNQIVKLSKGEDEVHPWVIINGFY